MKGVRETRGCGWALRRWALGVVVGGIAGVIGVVAGSGAGCSADRGERYPDIAVFVPPDTGGRETPSDVAPDAGALGCEARCGGRIEARAFKFTHIFVTEPNETTSPSAGVLIQVLNDLWRRDIEYNLLNLLFEVGDVDYATGVLTAEAGPAWYRRTAEAAARVPNPMLDEVREEDIAAYCLLQQVDGQPMTGDFSARLDDTCGFRVDAAQNDPNGEGVFLAFHTGPTTDPVICAPEQGLTAGLAPNTIPMMIHFVRGRFSDDCTHIVEGFMSGCIALEHADRICMCLDSDYNCRPEPPPPRPQTYCQQHCGGAKTKFLNFGGLVTDVARIPPSCTVMGMDGIRIAAEFEAVVVAPERYDAVRSTGCEGPLR